MPPPTRRFCETSATCTRSPPLQHHHDNVDPEIAQIAGPQLVVPVMNARYALNAANARWGSLYDALYGTDVIPADGGAERGGAYNPIRGDAGHRLGTRFSGYALAHSTSGSHHRRQLSRLAEGMLSINLTASPASWPSPSQFVGYTGSARHPTACCSQHNGLHIEIQIDRDHPVGATDAAGVKDICLESALTTIQDCEDSVAAVDAEDKVVVYRNWLGLMKGDLTDTFSKGAEHADPAPEPRPSIHYTQTATHHACPGAASVCAQRRPPHDQPRHSDAQGNEIPEGFMDGLFTTFCALHDLRARRLKNSRTGSMYIVKPKMHGPDEVSLTVDAVLRKSRTCSVCHATPSKWASWMRSAALP